MKFLNKIVLFSFLIFFALSITSVFILYKKQLSSKITKEQNSTTTNYAIDINKTQFNLDEEEKNNIYIYETLSPAVVNITVYKTEYFSHFFDIYPQMSEGQGSGAIFDKSGLIITNYHVIGNADRLTVALTSEEKIYDADIVGIDAENDLAVLKLKNPPNDLTVIPLGQSNNLKVGQKVYAIGNPFGLDRTLTSGIISGLGRPIKSETGNVIEGAIQTDASINPGNSGGPLLDFSGNMIGINTMIISPSGGSVGLGFAIPIDTAKEVISDLVNYGYVKRGWIDATFLPITPRIARYLNYPINYGLMIMVVAKNGEAFKSGLRGGNEKAVYGNNIVYIGGDIIASVNGIKIADYSSLVQVLKNKKPGETVTVEYYRNNQKFTTKVKLIDKSLFVNKY
ncbi:MAG TPA: trypsin-like peptidase domain-containing protein [Spirochaetota bacterium]|nr:trypsin-like peptidase domain-containing protein [Spirochaetota bacterium]